jgi:hypothetical protein
MRLNLSALLLASLLTTTVCVMLTACGDDSSDSDAGEHDKDHGKVTKDSGSMEPEDSGAPEADSGSEEMTDGG